MQRSVFDDTPRAMVKKFFDKKCGVWVGPAHPPPCAGGGGAGGAPDTSSRMRGEGDMGGRGTNKKIKKIKNYIQKK